MLYSCSWTRRLPARPAPGTLIGKRRARVKSQFHHDGCRSTPTRRVAEVADGAVRPRPAERVRIEVHLERVRHVRVRRVAAEDRLAGQLAALDARRPTATDRCSRRRPGWCCRSGRAGCPVVNCVTPEASQSSSSYLSNVTFGVGFGQRVAVVDHHDVATILVLRRRRRAVVAVTDALLAVQLLGHGSPIPGCPRPSTACRRGPSAARDRAGG